MATATQIPTAIPPLNSIRACSLANPSACADLPSNSETSDTSKSLAETIVAGAEAESEIEIPPPSPTLSPSDPAVISLKFIFANNDGVEVILNTLLASSIHDIKCQLISQWPQTIAPQPADVDHLRLVSMGKGFLKPDKKALESFKLPKFTTHPTPVNVSVRPLVTGGKKRAGSGVGGGGASTPATMASTATAGGGGGGGGGGGNPMQSDTEVSLRCNLCTIS